MASADPDARQRYTTWRQLDPVLIKAVGILTDRDRRLLAALNMHRVLTTEQAMQLFFRNPTTTQHRLLSLERYRLLARFRPWRPVGTAQSHWTLDIPGLLVVEASRAESRREDETPDTLLRRMKQRRLWLDQLPHGPHLTHRVETTSFFTRLIWDARTHTDGRQLLAWWNERRLANELHSYLIDSIRPDGYGAWNQDGRTVEFFLEYDRGTEPLSRLRDKILAYPEAVTWIGRPVAVLFAVPSQGRLANLKSAIWPVADCCGISVAGAVIGSSSPNRVVWSTGSGLSNCQLSEVPVAAIGPDTTTDS